MRKRYWIILIYFLVITCSSEYDYNFIVYNHTHFKINTFKIDNTLISIEPLDASSIISWHFEGSTFNFAEPLLDLTIVEYSDSVNTIKNSIGEFASIPDLYKTNVNKIEITLRDDYQNKDYKFDIKVNK